MKGRICMMPDDESSGGGGDGQGAGGDVAQQLADLQAKVDAMSGELETSKATNKSLEQRLAEADKELLSDDFLNFKAGGRKGSSGGGGGDSSSDVIDLERASNAEIVAYLEKKHGGVVEAAVKELKKELGATRQEANRMAAQFDVALASMRHNGVDGMPSWRENEKAIFEIAKKNPTWDAEKCYQQFVLESKAEADRKAEVEKKKREDEEKAATERAGVPTSAATGKQLTSEEAADLAYRKAFGTQDG